MYKGELCKWGFSLLEETTRKVWLEPMATKNPEEVAYHVRKIWGREGPPKRLRNDCGKEFHGISLFIFL